MTTQPAPQQQDTPTPAGPQQAAGMRHRERIAAVLADWRTRWPAVFTTPVPLAVGISRRIKDALGPECPQRRDAGSALHQWTHRSAYLRAVARGDMRRNLDGSEAGLPDEEARNYARQTLAEREQRAMERMRRERQRRQASSEQQRA